MRSFNTLLLTTLTVNTIEVSNHFEFVIKLVVTGETFEQLLRGVPRMFLLDVLIQFHNVLVRGQPTEGALEEVPPVVLMLMCSKQVEVSEFVFTSIT